jgi:oligosaccharyltransferase complex subunit alpha (ribophorin I)
LAFFIFKLIFFFSRLEKEFSRVQYQLTAQVHEQTNVLKSLSFDLPVSAHDPYYRDEVGNVSTSNFRVEAQKSVLEIRPRYPLFGGWNYTWYHGYNADLGSFVHRAKDGKYILNVNFVENVKEMTIDHAIVRAVLPEGAT